MWSWHLAQPTVMPMKAVETVSTAAIGSSPKSLPSRTDGAAGQEAEREQIVRAGAPAASGGRRPPCGALRRAVAGQLRADELVIGQVVVERVDHPVAPVVDAGRGIHALVGVGIAQDVEPVAAVADAVLLAGEQAVDDLFVSVRRFVVEEGVLLGGRRRDADQVEIDAAQERALVGRTDGLHLLFCIHRLDERVDGIRDRGRRCRECRTRQRLQGPEFGPLVHGRRQLASWACLQRNLQRVLAAAICSRQLWPRPASPELLTGFFGWSRGVAN